MVRRNEQNIYEGLHRSRWDCGNFLKRGRALVLSAFLTDSSVAFSGTCRFCAVSECLSTMLHIGTLCGTGCAYLANPQQPVDDRRAHLHKYALPAVLVRQVRELLLRTTHACQPPLNDCPCPGGIF